MDHSGHISSEDRLFMSSPRSYPGQGSFTLTVQGGQVRSVRSTTIRPQHLAQVDQLANSMMNMELQVNNKKKYIYAPTVLQRMLKRFERETRKS